MRLNSLLLPLALVLLLLGTSSSAASRPNFVFIYTDDQRYDAMGIVQKEQGEQGRFPWFQTPHMDRLASQGVHLRNAFVVNSLCSPSRANFLTGKYNHLNGVTNNHTPMPLDTVTFGTLLKDAGYTTAYFGKFHHGSQKERPGFEIVKSFLGQGKFFDCQFNINGTMTGTKGWVDDVTTDFAIDFLKERKQGDKPFAMVIGYKSPHGPRQPPPRAAERFEGKEARAVPNLDVRPPYVPAVNRQAQVRVRLSDAVQRGGYLNYFRTISAIDDCLGRLMEALEAHNFADATVLVFTSDNGYYLGEHGLGDKRSAYEESIRIPMLIRYPGKIPAGSTREEMVLSIDIAPTLLDYAGVSVPRDVQGRSARPLLEGASSDWRQSFFYAYFFERNYKVPTVTAVRTADAKLIKYPGNEQWTELFDLKNDPHEIDNLIDDPAAATLRRRMQAEYDAQAEAVGFRIPQYADRPENEAQAR